MQRYISPEKRQSSKTKILQRNSETECMKPKYIVLVDREATYIMLEVALLSSRDVDVLNPNVLSVPRVNHHIPRVAIQAIRPIVETLS